MITAVILSLGVALVPAIPASAASYTLTATRATSGTTGNAATNVDPTSACPEQGTTATAHCAGLDTSVAATDQILRTGDRANVRFDFAFDGADSGVVLRSTLPLANGGAAASWTAIPAACAAGSTLSDGDRTLNCLIANPPGAGDGSVTATMRLEPLAYDGYTFTVDATIQSASSAPVSAASSATFTSSSAPLWDARKNVIANVQPVPFFYRGPGGEPGFAIPTSTMISASKVGGYSPLTAPITWTETATSAAIGMSEYRLLNWGNYGQDGCAADGTAATPAVSGYPTTAIRVSNQYGAVSGGQYDCTQAAPGAPVQVTWTNPPASPAGNAANVWIMMWVPLTAVPIGTTPAPTVTVSAFDPSDVNGVSNYFAGAEPTTNNAAAHGNIVNADNRTITKQPISETATPYAQAQPAGNGATSRGAAFQTMVTFTNTGTVSQTPVQLCDVFDVTTSRLSAFQTSGGVPAGTFAVVTSSGPTSDPITAPPYRPASTYNNSDNFAVDPASYVVEYAAGELGAASPTTAPAAQADLQATGCSDADTATGWRSSPDHPDIVAYAASLGLSDPFDVVNRVRITFIGGAIEPGVKVNAKFHFTTRSVYRAATSQAGQTIFATTRILDVGAHAYPQSTVAAWTKSAVAGPAITGRINVDTNVGITASPTTVQAGAPGQNRTTYTLTPTIAFGENVSNTQPLRVVNYLPVGMRYVAGSASLAPDHVLPQANGSTVLVWDLGMITGTTNGVTTLPGITFQGEADPLAPTPAINYDMAISESVSSTGAQIDQDLPGCATVANMLTLDIPPTPTVPVASTTLMPPPNDYSGCFGQGQNLRLDYQPITIGNAFLDLAAAKQALAPQIESGADDGVAGAAVGWNLVYANMTSNTFDGVDIIDVLPYQGDGRSPASDFSGTISLSSLSTTDTISSTPNQLPVSSTVFPPRAGTTFYLTNVAPGSVERDPYADSNVQGGSTRWCLQSELGIDGCPATLADVTAFRVISGSMPSQTQRSVRIGLATDGAEDGDIINNSADARAIGLTTPVTITGDAITFEASSIEGTVWEDIDGDGVIGADETVRLEGVTVSLSGTSSTGETVTRSVQTAAGGAYAFPGLAAGDYTVTVDQADARAIDAAYAIASDPDGIATPDGSFTVSLPLNTTIAARDFGFATASLSGTVFGDDDNDGVIDAGEDGIGSVTVTLTGTDDLGGSVNRNTTTASDGSYAFADLRPGTYGITKAQPAGTIGGRNVPGTAGGTGGAVGTNTISGIPLEAAENGVAYLFGELVPEIVAGLVFEDLDNDGVAEAGEAGIAGVTITLTGEDAAGAVSRTTTTFADGTFTFADLRPGTYQLVETQPSGYVQGTTSIGGSGGTVSGDTISQIEVGGPDATTGYRFAELLPSSIAGSVYDDLNVNGARDAGEPGIGSVAITVNGPGGPYPASTDANGDFVVTGLAPGTYTVTAAEGVGYFDAFEAAGTSGGSVDNTSGASHSISGVTIGAGAAATGYLFGDVREATLSGSVYLDSDADGTMDAGEPGIGNTTVALTGTDLFGATVTRSVVTLPNGSYVLDGLLPGTYTVTETQPAGYFDGLDTAGSAGGAAGDDTVTGVVLGSGATATGYLFGEVRTTSVSGVVFEDLDGDGVQDAGEAGIPGVTITVRDAADAAVATAVSTSDGSWTADGVEAGTYSIVEEGQPLAGYVDGASVAGTSGGTPGVNTITGVTVSGPTTGYLFAEIPFSAIRGAVWHDADDDGVQDAGEDPIAGVLITLSGAADRTTTTNADGSFVFGGLAPGTYTITEADLDNWADGRTVTGPIGGTAAVNSVSDIVIAGGVDASGYGFGERMAELQLIVSAQTLDAQLETGPYVAVGSPVRLTYRVVNNGDTVLNGVTVTDDVLGEITCPATEVQPHSSMDCLQTISAIDGQQQHTGGVTAAVVPSATGGPSTLAITELSAADVTHYFGMVASATMTAEVDDEDAVTAPGPVFPDGGERTVVVMLTNTGNVPLEVAGLDTGELGMLECGIVDVLPVGESIDCFVTWTPAPGNYEFPVSASFTGPVATAVDGQQEQTEIIADTTVFFQVLEPGVQIPETAHTGSSMNWGLSASALLVLLLGGAGLVIWDRRRQPMTEG